MRIALVLEYDGSNFCGWQSQRSGGSVQDTVEAALSKIAGHDIRVVAAGRTDARVHASYQVLHFDTHAKRPMSAWVRGVNALIPGSIAVQWASQVPDEFHARYCALERCYLYLLLNHPIRPGLYCGKIGWFHQVLDLESMRAGAKMLLGEHDFSAFRAAECQAKSPVRNLTKLKITRQGDIILFELRANAFLHHMVRNIVGCLIYVGKGKYPAEWIDALLKGRKRIDAAPTFPAAGLYLAGVTYDAKWKLPAFADSPLAMALPRMSGPANCIITDKPNE
ncbi:tRNA pseudouridine(38-40) synthase TruA [Nitrosovibrio sp. Nv6]|uniref:tRNA pseudouridine(38-40) synthase TruA n=1 Tax=Nitrosovibrio sp. Nv6 TaxID=1855340 RepID=UPI0008CA47E6|nr:tRNA pseudouridine(38-40) synthase TruA [Nitrosovibrio sp. Nv6]SEO74239.1 tRNA pseudouridine38-40 synthase [Nitrosovibrio sp. Nv6]